MDCDEVLNKAHLRRSLPSPIARRSIREEAQLTQADLAIALKTTPAAVSRWEAGERSPRGALLDAYASLLDRLKREVLSA